MELRGKFLANVPLLSLKVLSREEQFQLVGKLRPWNFDIGDTIFEEGDIGDTLYIIEGGTCDVWKLVDGAEKKVAKINKGDFFGETSVMYDMPRNATVRARTSVTLLSLCRADLWSTLKPETVEHMKVLARAQFFSTCPIFMKLDTETKVLISGSLRVQTWKPGSVVIRENTHVGGPSRRLYFVETGTCLVSRARKETEEQEPVSRQVSGARASTRGGGGGVRASRVDGGTRKSSCFDAMRASARQAGDHFAMLEFLYGCPHMQTITAVDEVVTLSISYDEMWKLLRDQNMEAELIFTNMTKAVRIHLIMEAHPSLGSLSDSDLETLLASARTHTYEQWETISRKGEKMQHLTIFEQGRCIEYDGNADTLMENTMSRTECVEHSLPGETFGTKAMILRRDPPAPVTIVAIDRCQVLHISKSSFEALPRFRNMKSS